MNYITVTCKAPSSEEEEKIELSLFSKANENSYTTWIFRSSEKFNNKNIEICFQEDNYISSKISFKTISEEIQESVEDLAELIFEFLYSFNISEGREFEPEENSIEKKLIPFDPELIDIRNDRWSILNLIELMKEDQDFIDLVTDFQRNFVWEPTRQCKLIESLMLNIPVPAFYLAETKDGRYQIVDGLQRITTIQMFFDNKLKLKNLEYLNSSNPNTQENRYYKTDGKKKGIDKIYKRNFDLTQINVNIIRKTSPTRVKYDIFKRINTGGKVLNNQEIRNSFCNSNVRNFIKELALSDALKRATNNSVKIKRFESHELVLRYISFWYLYIAGDKNWAYSGEMTSYLDASIDRLNEAKKIPFTEIRSDFLNSMETNFYLFGKYAFRKCLTEHIVTTSNRQQLLNKALFTILSILLSKVNKDYLINEKLKNLSFAMELAKHLESKEGEKLYLNISYKTNDRIVLQDTFNLMKLFLLKHLELNHEFPESNSDSKL